MPATSDIKVSVNEAKNKKTNKNSNQTAQKTVNPKKPRKENPVSANTSKNTGSGNSSGKSKGGLFRLLATAVITTAVVGGGIYIWQQRVNEKTVDKLTGEARDAKLSLEDRIENLKRKLTGTESENTELKQITKELEERMAILDKARIDYMNEELSLAFTYPAAFGDIDLNVSTVGSSTKFTGKFTDNEKLIFGGAGEDFVLAGTSTMPEATELRGFVKRRNDYFLIGPKGEEYKVKPVEVIDTKNGEAILVDSKSFVLDDGQAVPVNIGQNAALVVNLENSIYSGLSFMNSDFGAFPLESFKGMIKTFETINIK